MERDALIIMAKAPDPEQTKTRLKGALSDDKRLALYTELLEGAISRLRAIDGVQTYITYAPEQAGEFFRQYGLPLLSQEGKDIGLRMHNALAHVLGMGHERAALVGVDIPGLGSETVHRAFALLEVYDCVFGPARDGGYYLVALKHPLPALFEDIPWSSPDTLRVTKERARELGLSVGLTETLADIDIPDDLRHLLP